MNACLFSCMLQKTATIEERKKYFIEIVRTFKSELDSVQQVANGFKMHFNTLDSLYLNAKELGFSDKTTCQIFHYIKLGDLSLTSGFYVRKNSPFQEPFNLK